MVSLLSSLSMGYKPFLRTIKGQRAALAKLVEQTPPSLQLEVSGSSSPASFLSVEEGNLSPTVQSIHTELDSATMDSIESMKDDKATDCTLS